MIMRFGSTKSTLTTCICLGTLDGTVHSHPQTTVHGRCPFLCHWLRRDWLHHVGNSCSSSPRLLVASWPGGTRACPSTSGLSGSQILTAPWWTHCTLFLGCTKAQGFPFHYKTCCFSLLIFTRLMLAKFWSFSRSICTEALSSAMPHLDLVSSAIWLPVSPR